MPEGQLGIRVSEAAVVTLAVSGDDQPEGAVGRLAEHGIPEVARANLAGHLERLGQPQSVAFWGLSPAYQGLVEEREVRGGGASTSTRDTGLAQLRPVECL